MARLEIGMAVCVIATGRVGQVEERERTKVTVCFFDQSVIPEEVVYKDTELKPVELPQMKTSQLKPFVRGELSLTDITGGSNLVSEYVRVDSKAYKISTEDLLAGVKVYEGKPVLEIVHWLDTLTKLSDSMDFPDNPREKILDKVTEDDIMAYAYNAVEGLEWLLVDDMREELEGDDMDPIKDLLETWVKSEGKEIPSDIEFDIARQFDCDDIDKQSEATQQLFKKCLDFECDIMRNPESIQRRGYCYYCGTKVYPNDWVKARDAFLDFYELTGDASAANTLGYIYYYGRCNGGEPEYEKAFYYFSIGNAFGYYESTYKLADMFAKGLGVIQDGETACRLYKSVYDETLKVFMEGEFDNKFADAALRMGNCYKDGIMPGINMTKAYYYYLQADCAIKKRIQTINYYGDTVVYNSIQKALKETGRWLDKARTEEFDYPEWLKWTLIDHRRCRLSIKEIKNGALSISAMPLKRRNEKKAPKMLITLPLADYCELHSKIHVKTAPGASYGTVTEKSEIVFDSFQYDWKTGKTSFYLHDDLVGEITTEYYLVTAPRQQKESMS